MNRTKNKTSAGNPEVDHLFRGNLRNFDLDIDIAIAGIFDPRYGRFVASTGSGFSVIYDFDHPDSTGGSSSDCDYWLAKAQEDKQQAQMALDYYELLAAGGDWDWGYDILNQFHSMINPSSAAAQDSAYQNYEAWENRYQSDMAKYRACKEKEFKRGEWWRRALKELWEWAHEIF